MFANDCRVAPHHPTNRLTPRSRSEPRSVLSSLHCLAALHAGVRRISLTLPTSGWGVALRVACSSRPEFLPPLFAAAARVDAQIHRAANIGESPAGEVGELARFVFLAS